MFKDLREFIAALEGQDQVRTLRGVDWDLEIGALTEMAAEADVHDHPALLFDAVKGYPKGYRVLTNILTTVPRCAVALGLPHDTPGLEVLRHWKDMCGRWQPIPCRAVSDGPVLENIRRGPDVDMEIFPTPRWHELDPGRFIGTGNMVVMKDPDGDWINVAAQRNVIYEKDTLGILSMPGKHPYLFTQRHHARGESVPVAICFGQEPATWIPAGMFLPYGRSEYDLAGALRGAPVEVIRGEVTGLPFPATAEIVIEGEITPRSVEERIEGPFGEYTGYYGAGPAPQPVVKVKALYYRNDPILFGVPPIRPPFAPYTGVPFPAGDTWDALEKAGVPDVVGVWQPLSRLLTVIAIRQRYAGHAKQALLVAAGSRGTAYVTKYVIVVDDDIDVTNLDEVMWAVVTRTNPDAAIDIVRDTWSSSIDPALHADERLKAAHGTQKNSKALINACRPYAWRDEFPAVNRVSEGLRKAMRAKFAEFLAEVEGARRPSPGVGGRGSGVGEGVLGAGGPRREGHFQDGM